MMHEDSFFPKGAPRLPPAEDGFSCLAPRVLLSTFCDRSRLQTMFAATIALALVASVTSRIQSGPTLIQDTAPASKVQAAHKHVPSDSRRALFLHFHTPHAHVSPPMQPLPPLQPPPPPWPPGYPLPADHVLVSSTPQLRHALTGETDHQILVLRAGAHLALDGVQLSIGAGRRVRIVGDGDGPWPVIDGATVRTAQPDVATVRTSAFVFSAFFRP